MGAALSIAVIVPAYNEEKTIATVVREVGAALPGAAVVVVNDGSADQTGAAARSAGAAVIDLPFNLGIGAAVQTGYRYVYRKGFAVAVQVDGDGQHDPAEIPRLLEALESGADLAVGSRFLDRGGYETPRLRRLGILFFSLAVSLLTWRRFTDTTSGFRAANRRVIERFAGDYPSDYPEPEAVLLLSRAGFDVREVPARLRERGGGHSSITALRSMFYMCKVFLALLMGTLRRSPKRKEE